MNATFRTIVRTVVFVAVAGIVAAAHAQPSGFGSAGYKQGVNTYWPAQASARYIEQARNYAQTVQVVVAAPTPPEPSVVREFKTELGRYLEDAQKHIATMKKDFANDKEAVAAIEGIDKELTAAIHHNKEMITCCEKQTFDKVGAMACCTDLVKALDKVHADHVALMKKLSVKYPAPAAKR